MKNESPAKVQIKPELKLLYASSIEIDVPQMLGPTPHGERKIINITGGTFEGPRMKGRVLPGGADWQIIGNDKTAEVEARYTLETEDGELIYIYNWGYRHGPPEVIERLALGEQVDPNEYYFRTTPRFETSAKAYDWLNRIVCIAIGERKSDVVNITVYEVS